MIDDKLVKLVILNAQKLDDLISELQSIRIAFKPTLGRKGERELTGELSGHDFDVLVGDNGCLTVVREAILIGRDY